MRAFFSGLCELSAAEMGRFDELFEIAKDNASVMALTISSLACILCISLLCQLRNKPPTSSPLHSKHSMGVCASTDRPVAAVVATTEVKPSVAPVDAATPTSWNAMVKSADAAAMALGFSDSQARAIADHKSGADTEAMSIDTFVRSGGSGVVYVEQVAHAKRWLVLRGILIEERNVGVGGADTPLHRVLVASSGPAGILGRVASYIPVALIHKNLDQFPLYRPSITATSVMHPCGGVTKRPSFVYGVSVSGMTLAVQRQVGNRSGRTVGAAPKPNGFRFIVFDRKWCVVDDVAFEIYWDGVKGDGSSPQHMYDFIAAIPIGSPVLVVTQDASASDAGRGPSSAKIASAMGMLSAVGFQDTYRAGNQLRVACASLVLRCSPSHSKKADRFDMVDCSHYERRTQSACTLDLPAG